MRRYYNALFRAGVNVDMIRPTEKLDGYRAVLAPDLYVLPDAVAGNLSETWPFTVVRGQSYDWQVGFADRWLWPPMSQSAGAIDLADMDGATDLIVSDRELPLNENGGGTEFVVLTR
jgi:hypothetical protein